MSPDFSKRILVVTGRSGGHIFPALGFLDKLKTKEGIDALLVLPKTAIIRQIESSGYKVKYVLHLRIKARLFPFALIGLFRLALESAFALLEFRPHLVVGFGSITSVPMIIFARIFGIRTMIHEQNVLPGRANRFLAGFADRIAVSFNETQGYFKLFRKKLRLTGNPLRRGLIQIDKQAALNFFGFNPGKFTILVIGGSQGSHSINYGFLKAVAGIPERSGLQVIHLSGTKECEAMKAGYAELNINAKVFDFFNAMQYAYSAADLVVSRGGAATVSEIIFFGVPAIIVPYPYAYRHQLLNARALEKKGSAYIINDNELGSGILGQTIAGLVNGNAAINRMRLKCVPFIKTGSDALLAEEALSLVAG